jgi:membrane-bound ClpP family serine protease
VLLAVGVLGLLLLVSSFFLDDLLGGAADLDSGWISLPAVGAFLAALGFVGWAAVGTTDSTAAGAVIGLAAGLGVGGAAVAATRFLRGGSTDATPRAADLQGKQATVLTPVPPDGFGEVVLHHLGTRLKVSARTEAGNPIAAGVGVRVVSVESDTLVTVEPEAEFWGGTDPPRPTNPEDR